MKVCSCGRIYPRCPRGAQFAPDAIVAGYYFNCTNCHSTMVWPLQDAPKGGFRFERIVYAFIILGALWTYFTC
jgi:hypothetical protein